MRDDDATTVVAAHTEQQNERVLISMTFKSNNVHTDRFTAFRTFITLSI